VKGPLAARQLGYRPACERVWPTAATPALAGFPGDKFEDSFISRCALTAGPAELGFKGFVCHSGWCRLRLWWPGFGSTCRENQDLRLHAEFGFCRGGALEQENWLWRYPDSI